MQRHRKKCRSQELPSDYLLATINVDTTENEPDVDVRCNADVYIILNVTFTSDVTSVDDLTKV